MLRALEVDAGVFELVAPLKIEATLQEKALIEASASRYLNRVVGKVAAGKRVDRDILRVRTTRDGKRLVDSERRRLDRRARGDGVQRDWRPNDAQW